MTNPNKKYVSEEELRAKLESLSYREIGELLEKCIWMQDLMPSQIDTMARHMRVMVAPKDSIIFKEGEKECYLGIVVKGQISVWKQSLDMEMKEITRIPTGQTFGEMSLLDERPRSATIKAQAHSLILILTKDEFLNLVNNSPKLALHLVMKIAKMMSFRLRMTSGRFAEHLHEEEQAEKSKNMR